MTATFERATVDSGSMPPSTSQVNRAGKVLRDWWLSPLQVYGPKEDAAFILLLEYRAAHAMPLIKANNGLRSMLKTEGLPIEVSQRLKRVATMVDKLGREPTMALSRMQDIGGCRAIVQSIDDLRAVQQRLMKNRPPVRVADYIVSPRSSGYRAVHVVVTYDGRCIEVQLRTQLMHEWAVAVERLGGQMDEDLKSGRGPREVLEWLETVSQAMEMEDAGKTVDTELMQRISRLRAEALPFTSRRPR
jgi:putative GTP pyrophosphokinase